MKKKIFDAITNLDDDLIKEARETKLKKKKRPVYKWIGLAASLVIVLAIGLLLSRDEKIDYYTGPIMDVIYPKAYAFEDFDTSREIREQNPIDENFLRSIRDFSYETGSLILKETNENTNYSPLSLYYALALAASGAENETQEEFLDLLGVEDKEELVEQSGNLYRTLYKDNEVGKLRIANSLWMDDMDGQKIEFKEDFIKQAGENFYASSHSVDFSDSKTGKAMAEWISGNTNGTLAPDIETSPDQILSIINTIYFYDEWIDRFDKDKTEEDTFFLSDGNEIRVDFMNQIFGSQGFRKGEGFTSAGLPMKNAGRMVFILPDEGISPQNLLSSPDKIKEAFEGGDEYFGRVVWKIPKFSFGSEFEMVEMLKSLGLQSAFKPDADFSGISDRMSLISKIRQDTHIAIDEIGVEASAFTQIDYVGSAQAVDSAEMILDRPFIYGIETSYGNLLFLGICQNPIQ